MTYAEFFSEIKGKFMEADISDITVKRPVCLETTALGAALLAGLGHGVFASLDEVKTISKTDKEFAPLLTDTERKKLLDGWKSAVTRVQ